MSENITHIYSDMGGFLLLYQPDRFQKVLWSVKELDVNACL